MTTIAYRDGVLAADSLISSGTMRAGHMTKIARCPAGWIGGVSGGLEAISLFAEWLRTGRVGECPSLGENSDGVLVRPDGTVFYVGPRGSLSQVRADFVAIGSGEKVAVGAMAMGADARRAVEVAAEHDTATGGEIVTLALEIVGGE